MAKGKKTGGRDFQPGQVANPAGFPKLTDEQKALRKLGQIEFEIAANKILFMTLTELEEHVENPETSVLEATIGKVLLKGHEDSEIKQLNYFVERFLGKVPDNVNVAGNLNTGLVEVFERMAQGKRKELTHGKEETNKEDSEENDEEI